MTNRNDRDHRSTNWPRLIARRLLPIAAALVVVALAVRRLVTAPATRARAQSTSPDFVIPQANLSLPLKIIAYGDTRFTDPHETEASNPKVRLWLVDKIAAEKPGAVLLSGDVPWHGGNLSDYAEYRSETKIWRDERLRIFPALGNHELNGFERDCLDNWWSAFPSLHGLRWYSVELGDSVYLLNLDSNSSLLPGSPQIDWLRDQLAHLPSTTRFVFFNLHHPPVVDFQPGGDPSHNGRPNEKALARFLAASPAKSQASFVVTAGHIHNYERFFQDGIVYLVSGGGGATPYPIVRHPGDLYQDLTFPNYDYVKFVKDGDRFDATMIRLADPGAAAPSWQEKDHFVVGPPTSATATPGIGRAAHH
jgi:hypothetical protein